MTTDFILVRIKQNDFATYGELYRPPDMDEELWVTIERPWVDKDQDGHRDRNVSRFAPGHHRLFLRKSHLNGGDGKRDYDVWQFENVPDVDAAQIHIANLPDELEGCVGIGLAFGEIQRTKDPAALPGIIGSSAAFGHFMELTKHKTELWIEVRDAF